MAPRRAPPPFAPLPIRLVLMRPRTPENVGAVARAMKNFGLTDWGVVAPEYASLDGARKLAVHAEDLLLALRPYDSLDAAVADCVWVVGTSSRYVEGKQRLAPAAFASEAQRRGAGGTIALVFGDERSGLTNEEVQRCHALSSIPTDPEQPSVNLAQAALLYAYELRRAQLESTEPKPRPRAKPATDAEVKQLTESLTALLRVGGFLAHDERHAVRDLLAPLVRGEPTEKEARLWIAALRAVTKRLTGDRPP